MSKKSVRFVVQTSHIIKPARVRIIVHPDRVSLADETGVAHTAGLTQRYHIDGRKLEENPTLSTIHFYRDGLRTGIIAHEATHAAIHIHELTNKPRISSKNAESEEDFCYTVGDIVSKIVNGLYKRGLLIPGKPTPDAGGK